MLWQVAVGVVAGLVFCWVAFVVVLWRHKPTELTAREAARLLPDLLRLVGRLARDQSTPRRVRVYLWLLLAYLALPFDLVPDFVPALGYADDVVAIALVLRAVVAASGTAAVERHWTGSPEGLRAVLRVCGLAPSD